MKPLLDHPKIRRLLSERGTRSEFREPRRPMTTKVLLDAHIGIQSQKLADDFHRDHFTIRQFRGKATLA